MGVHAYNQPTNGATKAILWFNRNKDYLAVLVILSLSGISIFFNYQLGKNLSYGLAEISILGFSLLGLGYALLDCSSLLCSAYLSSKSPQWNEHLRAKLWVALLVCFSLFSAWSYQCYIDASKEKLGAFNKKDLLVTQLALEKRNAEKWQSKLDSGTTWETNTNNKLRDSFKSQQRIADELERLEAITYPAEHAVFYRSPVLRDSPETWLTLIRFIAGALMTLNAFILIKLAFSSLFTDTPTIPESTEEPKTRPHSRTPLTNQQDAKEQGRTGAPLRAVKQESTPNTQADKINDMERFKQVRRAILEESVRPTQESIKTAYTIGSQKALDYLRLLCEEGVLKKKGNRFQLEQSAGQMA
jgi:hypothetical protein